MEWRTFWQRLILLTLLSILVLGLITAGLDPYLALGIVAGIVVLLKDMWLPSGKSTNEEGRRGDGGPLPRPPGPPPAARDEGERETSGEAA